LKSGTKKNVKEKPFQGIPEKALSKIVLNSEISSELYIE
jgi:hypothetical protein